MREPAVLCQGLTKRYHPQGAAVVDGVDLSIEAGTTLALLGPSGSGKTTALRLIAGFEAPDGGRVVIGGREVAAPGRFVPPEGRRVGMVFQDYALFPHLTVSANVGFGVSDRAARAKQAEQMLTMVGLQGLGARMPHELSGGQQQRVALARALCPQPAVLLLDEPFSNLDERLRAQVRTEVRDILRLTHTTALFVTHDQDEALFMGDRVAVLNQGRVEQQSTPEEIYQAPATRFVAEFMGTADFLPVTYADGRLSTVAGAVAWVGEPPPAGVEALLRPDDITIAPDSAGQGTVIGRVFQGPSYLYEVALDGGYVVRVTLHHSRRYSVGARVAMRIVAEHPLTLFLDGRAVG